MVGILLWIWTNKFISGGRRVEMKYDEIKIMRNEIPRRDIC